LNGKDFLNLPVEERKAALEKLLNDPPGVIRYSASIENANEDLLDKARELGVEGLIGKRIGSRYEPGERSGAWIKIKLQQQQEFVIGGYTEPEGTRKYFGAVLVGAYEADKLQFVGKVGTGFNEELLRSLYAKFKKIPSEECPFANLPEKRSGRYGQGVTPAEMKRCHWVQPILVCETKFAEWTRDNRLRQPVFLGLREDKDAKEVVREKA
jgi:bifunctional non-homologous end joining protein LigD